MGQHYTVRGRWSFPLDMLRYDEAEPATPEDSALIEKLSGESCPDDVSMREIYAVRLVRHGRGRPATERWASFMWIVFEIE